MSQFGSQIHRSSRTKISGSGKKVIKARDKNRSEMGNYFSATKVSDKDSRVAIRRRGGHKEVRLKHAAIANVLTKAGYKKAKISGVMESKDNRNFARQSIVTKGSIIITELGNAVVLNRPGREGFINAKLVA